MESSNLYDPLNPEEPVSEFSSEEEKLPSDNEGKTEPKDDENQEKKLPSDNEGKTEPNDTELLGFKQGSPKSEILKLLDFIANINSPSLQQNYSIISTKDELEPGLLAQYDDRKALIERVQQTKEEILVTLLFSNNEKFETKVTADTHTAPYPFLHIPTFLHLTWLENLLNKLISKLFQIIKGDNNPYSDRKGTSFKIEVQPGDMSEVTFFKRLEEIKPIDPNTLDHGTCPTP